MLHNIRITIERTTLVHPYVFKLSWFVKMVLQGLHYRVILGYFLVNLAPIKYNWIKLGRYWIMIYSKEIQQYDQNDLLKVKKRGFYIISITGECLP